MTRTSSLALGHTGVPSNPSQQANKAWRGYAALRTPSGVIGQVLT